MSAYCEVCDRPVVSPRRGRPRKYCSANCEYLARRQREQSREPWQRELEALLHELAPNGLTPECPMQRERAA